MAFEAVPQRLLKLRAILERGQYDAILVSCPENRCYLSGFTGSDGYLLVSSRAALLATDVRYYEQAKREAPCFELFPLKSYASPWLVDTASQIGVKKLAFEAGHLSYSSYSQFVDTFASATSQVKFFPQTGVVESLRSVKDASEIAAIEEAAHLAHVALQKVTGTWQPGLTEKEAAWRLERFMRESGSDFVPFEVIVASGPNAALPHHRPSDRAIGAGEPVVVDFGARVRGYCCDVTRTLWLGKAEAKLLRVHDIVYGAQRTAIELIKSGMTGGEADRLARTVIEQGGYADAFGHGLGHGVGLETHESPRLGPSSKDMLTEGMAFTVEPGVYLSGWGGVRIEDTVLMESKGVRVLC